MLGATTKADTKTLETSPGTVASRLAAQNMLFQQQYLEDHAYTQDEQSPAIGPSLGDYSINAAVREHSRNEAYRNRLAAISTVGFPEQDSISHLLLLRELDDRIESFTLKEYEMPVSQIAGPQLSLADLPKSSSFNSVRDYEDYITRLNQIPRVFAQTIEVLKLGVKDGLVPPRSLLDQIPAQCAGTIAEDPFLVPLQHFPASITTPDRVRLTKQIQTIVSSVVLPAYKGFGEYIAHDYAPKGRTVIGLVGLPDGVRRYQFAIRQRTTTDMAAAEIHALGLSEVTRINTLLTEVAHRAGYKDLSSYRTALNTDSKYIPTSSAQIVELFRRYVTQMRPRLGELFLNYQMPPLTVEAVPASQPRNGTHYVGGSQDGKQPARVVVLTSDYAHRSLISDETQAYHEGLPGHHLQLSIQQQLAGMPAFRRESDYAVFAEGWAVYAEALGKEIGFFQDPASDYGRLNLELMRAVRLVVDTGVHAEGWSREQAVAYYRESGATDEPTTQSEVDITIARPGRNLAYQIGKLKILELRHRAEEQLGLRLDIRAFHDQILGGGNLPMDLLTQHVEIWLSSETRQ